MIGRGLHRLVDLLAGSWPRRVVTLAVLVGFGLRLGWVLYAARGPVNLHDPFFYLDYGRRLSQGGGYRLADGEPTAYYPIAYPAILGLWYWLLHVTPFADHWIGNAMALNLIFSTATIALVATLGRRLLGPWVGALAAVIVALFPSLIFHTATILTETTFNFFFVLALLVLCWRPWSETFPSWARLGVFALLLGLCIEIRPIALLVVPMVGIALWRVGERRQALLRFGAVAAVVVVVMIPWTVRNQVVMKAFLPIGTTTGDNLCIGNHPGAQGHFAFPDWCFGHDPQVGRPEFETLRNSELTSRSLHWIAQHPLDQFRLVVQRTFYTFQHDHDAVAAVQSYGDDPFIPPVTATVLGNLADAWFFMVLGIGVLGLPFFANRRDPRRLLLLLSIVAVAISPWAFFGDSRFHIPINVLMPIPAALVLVMMGRRWRHQDDEPVPIGPPAERAPQPDAAAPEETIAVRARGRHRLRRRLVATAGLSVVALGALGGLGGLATAASARSVTSGPVGAKPLPTLGAFSITAHVTGETAGYVPGSRFTVTYDCGAGAIGALQLVDGDTEEVDAVPVGTVCHLRETGRPTTTDPSYAWGPEVWAPSATVVVTATPRAVTLVNPLHRVWGAFTVTARVTGSTAGYVAGSVFTVGYECSTGVSGTLQLAAGDRQGVGALPLGTTCTLTELATPATAGAGYAFGPASFAPAATITIVTNAHANTTAVVVTNPVVATVAPTTTTTLPADPTNGAVAVLGETVTPATLPRTGPSDVLLLAAIGLALVVGGACFVAASRIDGRVGSRTGPVGTGSSAD